MKQHTKFIIETIGVIIGGLAVVATLLIGRIMRGPMDVDFMKPVVQLAIEHQADIGVDFDHLALGAYGWGAPLEIHMQNATASDSDGHPILSLENAAITLSFRSLLVGRIRPIGIILLHPKIMVMRLSDGSYTVGIAGQQGGGQPTAPLLQKLAAPQQDTWLRQWEEFETRDAEIILTDQSNATLASASGIEFDVKRKPGGAEAAFDGAIAAGASKGTFFGSGSYGLNEKGTATFQSTALPLNAFAGLDPALTMIAGWNIPVSLNLTAMLNGLSVAGAHLNLDLGAGNITDPARFDEPVAIAGGQAVLSYAAKPEKLDLEKMAIDLGGPRLEATGTAETSGATAHVEIDAGVSNMPIDSIGKYWPKDAAKGGRAWVTGNLSRGIVPKASLHASFAMPRASLGNVELQSLTGTMTVRGGNVRYFGDLPPVVDAAAKIDFDKNSMTVNMTGGHVSDFALTGGTVVLAGFSGKDQDIKIDVSMAGPIRTAISILDHEPLHYAKKLKLDPQSIAGTTATQLHMAFPLIAALKADQIDVSATSDLQNLSMPDVLHHLPLQAFAGTLTVDKSTLELSGKGQLGDIPMGLDWKQFFSPQNGLASDATFDGTLDDRQRAELGIAAADRLIGPIKASGRYRDYVNTGIVDLAADLTDAEFKVDEIGYDKQSREPGNVALTINLDHGAVHSVDNILIKTKNFLARGQADLDSGQKLSLLKIDELRADDTNLAVTVAPIPNGGSRIDVNGPVFDARAFLHKRRSKDQDSADNLQDGTPLRISADIGRVKTSDTNGVDNIKGTLLLAGRKWRSAEFTADTSGQRITLSYQPDSDAPDPGYTLHADAQNAGAAFSGFALTDSVQGGVLHIDGVKQGASAQQPNPPLACQLTLTGFSVVKAPALARLFNLLSIEGFMETVSGAPIQFDSLTGRVEISDALLQVRNGKLAGSALGMTIEGSADRDAGTLDMQGTAVPAYSVNKFLHKIPLLGPVMTGRDGEGVFAATYRITGTFEKPDVSVNPLSVLAPGVLRDLFFNRSLPDEATEPAKP